MFNQTNHLFFPPYVNLMGRWIEQIAPIKLDSEHWSCVGINRNIYIYIYTRGAPPRGF